MSTEFSLSTVIDTFEAVISTLDESHYAEEPAALCQARDLQEYFLCRRFIMTALTYQNIFSEISPVSKILQSPDIDFLAAMYSIESAKKNIFLLRNDSTFEELVKDTDDFVSAKEKCLNYEIAPLPVPRQRKKKKMPGEESADEPIIDPLLKFKVDTFYRSIDVISQQLNERFDVQSVPVLKDLSLFTKRRIEDIQRSPDSLPKDAFEGFCEAYGHLVEKQDLLREYLHFCKVFASFEKVVTLPETLHEETSQLWNVSESDEEDESDEEERKDEDESETDKDEDNGDGKTVTNMSDFGENAKSQAHGEKRKEKSYSDIQTSQLPINSGSMRQVFHALVNCSLKSVFPSLFRALKTALTLPVSSAKPERSFSKLKIIKNRLRTTMSNKRLESLMLISCESDVKIDVLKKLSTFLLPQKYSPSRTIVISHCN